MGCLRCLRSSQYEATEEALALIVTIQRRWRARLEMRHRWDDHAWALQPTSAPFTHVRNYAARRRRWDAARRELLTPERSCAAAATDGRPLRLSALEIALAAKGRGADEVRTSSPVTTDARRAQMDWLAAAVDAMLTARGTPRGMMTSRLGTSPVSSRLSVSTPSTEQTPVGHGSSSILGTPPSGGMIPTR